MTAPVASTAADTELSEQAIGLADAFESPIVVWTRSDDGRWEEVLREPWREDIGPFAAQVCERSADDAIDSGAVILSSDYDDCNRRGFFAPLSHRSRKPFVATGATAINCGRAIHKLAGAVLKDYRVAVQFARLTSENDTFAAQLSSDLEELHFLRSIVARLKDSASSTELSGIARETLPILNETVRARCLAFLTPDGAGSSDATRVAYRIGANTPTDQVLQSVVREFGEQARQGALVRNWGASSSSILPSSDRPDGIRSLIICPLASTGSLFGWLVAVNRRPQAEVGVESSWQLASDEFGSGESTLMATSASILAMQASNVQMIREQEQLTVDVVRAMVAAIETKDKYTRGHSERVALYARRLAEEIGFFESEAEQIYLSGLLHDIGKIGVADVTLNKPGKLTDEEFAEIAKHPDEGWSILCDLKRLAYVLPGVLHHHERWDGRGYPDGIAGEAIPIEGRIMAVADAFDAMTSGRPYRPGMTNAKAEAILREGAGTQWDPVCVDAFFACIDEIHGIQFSYKQRERRQRIPSAVGRPDDG